MAMYDLEVTYEQNDAGDYELYVGEDFEGVFTSTEEIDWYLQENYAGVRLKIP
ncbi:MAG: hypothetical protein GY820_17355 [Gammaproteobacteria bacterium]|nr:hypothetical protein [Gammaproteobacteria bacterium]